jgi:hypothetical protein
MVVISADWLSLLSQSHEHEQAGKGNGKPRGGDGDPVHAATGSDLPALSKSLR